MRADRPFDTDDTPLLLAKAQRMLDTVLSSSSTGISIYMAAACLFLQEAEKEVRGERPRRLSPALQVALLDWVRSALPKLPKESA